MNVPIEIDVIEAARLHQTPGEILLLDVREPHEWKTGHVEGSVHIPMREIPGRLSELPRDRRILAFCHSGTRSLHVTQYLRANDYHLVSNIAGGIVAWAELIDPTVPHF